MLDGDGIYPWFPWQQLILLTGQAETDTELGTGGKMSFLFGYKENEPRHKRNLSVGICDQNRLQRLAKVLKFWC